MHYMTTKIDQGAYVFRKILCFQMIVYATTKSVSLKSEQLLPWIKKVVLGETSLDKLCSEHKSRLNEALTILPLFGCTAASTGHYRCMILKVLYWLFQALFRRIPISKAKKSYIQLSC